MSTQRLFLFRRLALAAAGLAAVVIVLGAWVRLTNAGLGCPDWPGCYGHLHPNQAVAEAAQINAAYPNRNFDSAKAWHEMIHRYVVGGLSLFVIAVVLAAFWNRKDPQQPRLPVGLLFVLFCLQAALGAFTVTLLLKPLIVTAHLLGGLTTLGLLLWLSRQPERRALSATESRLRPFAFAALAVLALQITLGGWTSTNYASVACPDFPTCQRSFWPTMDFRDAFVLWRGLGIDYEGGVLSAPARVAIHFTHRIGAVIAGCVLIGVGLMAWLTGATRRVRLSGLAVVAAVIVQISLGISTVLWGVPLGIATAHNAGAVLLVVSMVALLSSLSPQPAVRIP
jgi:cytochrome c oxidase assembly protein subunit 15